MIDHSGIFWFGSRESGLVKYDPVNKPFQHLAHDANNPNSLELRRSVWHSCFKSKTGYTVYVGTRGSGVNIYDPKSKLLKSNVQGC